MYYTYFVTEHNSSLSTPTRPFIPKGSLVRYTWEAEGIYGICLGPSKKVPPGRRKDSYYDVQYEYYSKCYDVLFGEKIYFIHEDNLKVVIPGSSF